MAEQSQQALADLDSAIQEVAGELTALAAKVEQGQLSDTEVAAQIRARAETMRGLRPDEPAPA